MDLSLDRPGDHHYIRSLDERGLRVGDAFYHHSLVITAEHLADWPPGNVSDLSASHLEPLLALDPEVVLFGTGKKQVFLAPEMMTPFYRNGIGFEVMTTEAACRTFNILVSEGRKVAAALILEQA